MVEQDAVNVPVAGSSPALPATWVPQEETTVLDTDDYYFALEEFRRGNDQMVFLHLVVHHWTPRVWREILRNWKLFRQHVRCPLWAVCGVEDTEKWERFVKRLGFQFHSPVVCENDAERRLFLHIVDTNEPSVATDHDRLQHFDGQRECEPVERPAAIS